MLDYRIIRTEEELLEAQDAISSRGQAAELTIGCETWGIILNGGQRGQMTRWPDLRGAVDLGGGSSWGDWSGGILTLDEYDCEPIRFGEDGIQQDTGSITD